MSTIFGNILFKTKFHHNYNKKCFILKAPLTFRSVTLNWHKGEKCSHMRGVLCSYFSSPWKTYLPGQPLHHSVHVYTIQSKHLLEETHSPTYTVNFYKYYKGKLLLFSRCPANFPKGIIGLIYCFWLHTLWK